MVSDLPGAKRNLSTRPIVMFSVWPAPSGLRNSFSIVTPDVISAFHWSAAKSPPPILIEMSSAAGASNNPGISSVNRIT